MSAAGSVIRSPMQRYLPDTPFPAYAFVPGQHPHPVTNPQGHSFGQPHVPSSPLDPERPNDSRTFLFAIDLFNAGYYWEAHEAWEELWVAAGRSGVCAGFLKALIKLAAAGVKTREGMAVGVKRHAARAAELLRSIQQSAKLETFAGLVITDLMRTAESLAAHPIVDESPSIAGRAVLPIQLTLVDGKTG